MRRFRTHVPRVSHVPLGYVPRPLDPIPCDPAQAARNVSNIRNVQTSQPGSQCPVRILYGSFSRRGNQVQTIVVLNRLELINLGLIAMAPSLVLNPFPPQLIRRVHPAPVRLNHLDLIDPVFPRQRPVREQRQAIALIVRTSRSLNRVAHANVVIPVRKILRPIRDRFKRL